MIEIERSCNNCDFYEMKLTYVENNVQDIQRWCVKVKSKPVQMELGKIINDCPKFKIKKILEWQLKL